MADNAIFGVTIADVAQLDRAFGYEPKGSRFESWHPQKKPLSIREGFLLVFFEGGRPSPRFCRWRVIRYPFERGGPRNAPDSGRKQ